MTRFHRSVFSRSARLSFSPSARRVLQTLFMHLARLAASSTLSRARLKLVLGKFSAGTLGVAIAKALNLDAAHKGLMVATPVLAGAALRVVLGLLVGRFKAKRVGIGAQIAR